MPCQPPQRLSAPPAPAALLSRVSRPAALSLAQRLAREAGQGTLREAVTRSSGGYVAIYAIGTSAVLVLLGDEGLDVTRLHRESRSVVENIEKLLA